MILGIKSAVFDLAVDFAGLSRGGIAEDVGWARECKAKSKLPRCSLAHHQQASICLVVLAR